MRRLLWILLPAACLAAVGAMYRSGHDATRPIEPAPSVEAFERVVVPQPQNEAPALDESSAADAVPRVES
jgi:hypothetical protein